MEDFFVKQRATDTVMMLIAILPSFLVCSSSAADGVKILEGLDKLVSPCSTAQIGIWGDVITYPAEGSIFYRIGDGPWKKSPIPLPGHSLARMPNGHWIMNYTAEAGQLVEVDDLSGTGKKIVRSEVAGEKLVRPHDQVVDPQTGEVYVIDGNRRLYRFKALDGPAQVWTFTPDQLGYARALSYFDGHVHIIDSSRGEVIRVDDYAKHKFTTFRSPRPKDVDPHQIFTSHPFLNYGPRDYIGGTLSSTGLALDDVDKAGDWYYGSNEFSDVWSPGTDARPARLIRWKTWADFETGKWQDLSSYIPVGDVPAFPYFLTIHDDILYAGLTARQPGKCPGNMQLDLRSIGK
jgi:hypothetical protein